MQGGNTVHVDPILFYGDSHTTVTGNYFHGNSTGIMAPDGTDHALITNNVFVTDGEYPDQIVIGGGAGDVIRHNTFAGGAGVRIGAGNVSPSVDETVIDNVVTGSIQLTEGQSASAVTRDYNLIRSRSGAHDVTARPAFAGGSTPSTFAGFLLAAGSPGTGAASDGTDMGAAALGAGGSGAGGSGAGGSGAGGSGASGSGAGGGARRPDAPPEIKLLRPTDGRLGRVLSLHAVATDDVRVARVEFRLDRRRLAARLRRPYGASRRVPAWLRRGTHTVSARAVDTAGQVSSVAAAIAHGHVLRGRVMSVPRSGGGTELRASRLGSGALIVRVARCAGGPARRVTLSRSRTRARLAAGGLCVVSLARR
jgi:hypothetical protein